MPATRAPHRKQKPARRRPAFQNFGELLQSLGDIPPARVLLDPYPGRATKRDLLRLHRANGRRYELVDYTLVENPMGRPEAFLALELGRLLANYVMQHKLGFCTGADDLIELIPGLVRGPDLCFTPWSKRPVRRVDGDAISGIIPDLAVEVLSRKNTPAEITRKLGEYFRSGVRLVWVIDHRKRIAEIYTSSDKKVTIAESGSLDGADVVPGFRVSLAELFEFAPEPKPKKRRK